MHLQVSRLRIDIPALRGQSCSRSGSGIQGTRDRDYPRVFRETERSLNGPVDRENNMRDFQDIECEEEGCGRSIRIMKDYPHGLTTCLKCESRLCSGCSETHNCSEKPPESQESGQIQGSAAEKPVPGPQDPGIHPASNLGDSGDCCNPMHCPMDCGECPFGFKKDWGVPGK